MLFLLQISKPKGTVIERATSVVDAALVSCDKDAYVKSAIESITKLVDDLLHVPTCGHASNANLLDDSDRIGDVSPTRLMEQDEEEDIRAQMASMLHKGDDDDDEEEEEEEDDEDEMEIEGSSSTTSPIITRKRKQLIKSLSPPTSPTSSPSKRPRRYKSPLHFSSAPSKFCQTASPALDLLETKKKVQRNSLYHWVLWREALRGEKDRVTNPRRLSYDD
jgi:hypothetical protein